MATLNYFDWQVSTLMLAYDLNDPIARTDDAGIIARQQACEDEVRELADAVIPQSYRDNPELDFPPSIIRAITAATITRAAVIAGLLGDVSDAPVPSPGTPAEG